jgi:sulfite reductase (ferredoxin)
MEGKKIKHEGKLTDAYYFCLGGAVGQHAAISRPVGYRCPAPLVPEAIERLLRQYLASRAARGEPARLVQPTLQRRTPRPPGRRSAQPPSSATLPTGRVPHGVAD